MRLPPFPITLTRRKARLCTSATVNAMMLRPRRPAAHSMKACDACCPLTLITRKWANGPNRRAAWINRGSGSAYLRMSATGTIRC